MVKTYDVNRITVKALLAGTKTLSFPVCYVGIV
jgi:hypothetical protein